MFGWERQSPTPTMRRVVRAHSQASTLASTDALPKFARVSGGWTVRQSKLAERRRRIVVPRAKLLKVRTAQVYSVGDRDVVDSSMRAEVSMATASAMRDKALAEYQESRCRGAAWLWMRAVSRAGGHRTLLLYVLRLWANYVARLRDRRQRNAVAIRARHRRRYRIILRHWSEAAQTQRRLRVAHAKDCELSILRSELAAAQKRIALLEQTPLHEAPAPSP